MDPDIQKTFGQISPTPEFFQKFHGTQGLGDFFTALISLIYVIGGLILALMIIWGALDWMLSGGEKDKVEGARNKILNAIIGFIILAITFAILDIIQQFTGFQIFVNPNP